jgi:hypothetical protein
LTGNIKTCCNECAILEILNISPRFLSQKKIYYKSITHGEHNNAQADQQQRNTKKEHFPNISNLKLEKLKSLFNTERINTRSIKQATNLPRKKFSGDAPKINIKNIGNK